MKRLLGDLRRADDAYHLIGQDARVAVGLSGGKDSMALLYLLKAYRRFQGKSFALRAVTVTTAPECDVSPLQTVCDALGVPFSTVTVDIKARLEAEKNPCALCARTRRGALLKAAKDAGCDTLALGHHRDDAVQTFVMSALNEGRLHGFLPKLIAENGVAVVRPLILAEESAVMRFARRENLPVCPLPCPYAGHTERQAVAGLLDRLEEARPGAKAKLAAALQRDLYPSDQGAQT